MSLFKRFCFGSLVLFLAACGGGGGSGSNTVDVGSGETVLIGQFIDSAVSGIRYRTETQSGSTDNNGQFEYLDGETVSLYIGQQLLGAAPGAATINLFDLVDGVNPLVGNALDTTIKKLNEKRNQDGKFRANFSTVINLAVLLQTLDTDGNPANGIEIQPDVAALFTANNIDFNQHWEDFKLEHGFRKALAEAKSRGLLDNTRQVRQTWRAMTHLYASLGLDMKLRPVNISTTANFGRGTPDSVTSFDYDEEGKMIRRAFDGDGTGTSDESYTYTYDANGNQTRYEYDDKADGTADSFRSYTYDADGNQTRMELGGENINSPERELRTFDIYGKQTRFEKYGYRLEYVSTQSYDDNGRESQGYFTGNDFGITNVNLTWTYNDSGYQLHRAYTSSGEPQEEVSTYTLNAIGDLLREERDYDVDGLPDRISTYTYNAQGDLTRSEYDGDANGTADSVETVVYDTAGNTIRKEWDYDNDGTPDRIYTYNYDAGGNQVGYAYDNDADGMPDQQSTTTYEYDADGNWIRSEHDDNGDGEIDSTREATYDTNGNQTRLAYDYGLDGTPDTIVTWEYANDTDGWWSILRLQPQ